MKAVLEGSVVTLALLLAACSTAAPPPELLEARTAYDHASTGKAATLKPDDLLTAKQELDQAERLFDQNGNDQDTRDAAYIATRGALFAQSDANTMAAVKAKAEIDRNAQQQTNADLSSTKSQLASTQRALDTEQTARADADRRAAAAMADLQKIASVKQVDHATVITLPGGVLFKTDKSELLPGAMAQLNQVADALTRNKPDSHMVVGGYTDSQGTESHNQDLSESRARAVADYLVSRGIAKDRVTSKGFGKNSPIADNTSVEGRAQNRRVEIVVDNGS